MDIFKIIGSIILSVAVNTAWEMGNYIDKNPDVAAKRLNKDEYVYNREIFKEMHENLNNDKK